MKKQVEFKPPSDFVAEDSGGGSNVWKYVGIGCGVILLAVGIAFAFGAWKTASCCGDAMDVAKYSMAAQNTAKTFASNVSRGNADKAYELTSSSFQERVSPDNFRSPALQACEDDRGELASKLRNGDEYRWSAWKSGHS